MEFQKRRNKLLRQFKVYRKYFLGFSFIAGIMILTLAIDLVKVLSTKIEEVPSEVSELESFINLDYPVSGYSMYLLLLSDNNITVIKNDTDIVSACEAEVSDYVSLSDSESELNSKSKTESDETKSESEPDEPEPKSKPDEPEPKSKPDEPEPESESSVSRDEQLEYNLAKLIDAEGSILDDKCQQLIAYCFLNRMRLNHWKNTFDGVLNDGIGYAQRTCNYVANPNNIPSEKARKNAKICLDNYYADTMPVPFNLVFQAGFKQGTIYYYDEKYGVYFCLADNLEPN